MQTGEQKTKNKSLNPYFLFFVFCKNEEEEIPFYSSAPQFN